MKAHKPLDQGPNWWRDIPGYAGKYQATPLGEVRRVYKSGLVKELRPYQKKACGVGKHPAWYMVKINCKEKTLHKIIAETFLKKPRAGLVCYHKNGLLSDNRAENLGFTTQAELGRITGSKASRRMSVFKIKPDGEVVAIYRSAREAAKMNAMSYQTVLDRCHGKIKNPYALDGYNYQFEDNPPGRRRK